MYNAKLGNLLVPFFQLQKQIGKTTNPYQIK